VTPSLLTAIILTRNRPDNLPGLIRLFQLSCYPVIVADSSDPDVADKVRLLLPDAIQYMAFSPAQTLYDKLELTLHTIETPFVMVVSDRKITFPHAVDSLLKHLASHEDHVAAQGYIIGFRAYADTIDINRVIWFTPTIDEADPLRRLYHLMRRYQSWAFGVFRTAALAKAVAQARRVEGALFQEILLVNAVALQGKMARLPTILSLQTEERSFHPPKRNDPLFWFLDDIGSFFRHYLRYREALTRFIAELGISAPPNSDLNQLVDMIHAVWLHHNSDYGALNHAARLLLGDRLRPLAPSRTVIPRHLPTWWDIVNQGNRRYIWRRSVLRAKPRNEIHILAAERAQVVAQLDVYFDSLNDRDVRAQRNSE